MKFRHSLILIALFATLFVSCFDESEDDGQNDKLGNWVTKAWYSGIERSFGTCFELNGFGYYGMGRDKDNDYVNDMWRYDPSQNSWTQVASFPGTLRAYNFSVANGSKGYVGTGYDEKYDLQDFWEFDPNQNESDTAKLAGKWTQLADFPGGKRRNATAFAIGSAIYAGTGYNGLDKTYFNDFYKYENGEWTIAKQFEGDKREGANTCVMDGKAYLISGHRSRYLNDFWIFDPEINDWIQLEDLDDVEEGGLAGINRAFGNAFSVEGKIYLFGGSNGAPLSTIFEWNPQTLEWIQKTSLETGYSRMGAGSFVINNMAYVVGGEAGGKNPLADFYLFQPSVEKEEDDN